MQEDHIITHNNDITATHQVSWYDSGEQLNLARCKLVTCDKFTLFLKQRTRHKLHRELGQQLLKLWSHIHVEWVLFYWVTVTDQLWSNYVTVTVMLQSCLYPHYGHGHDRHVPGFQKVQTWRSCMCVGYWLSTPSLCPYTSKTRDKTVVSVTTSFLLQHSIVKSTQ